MSDEGVRKAGPQELAPGQPTPGMTRREAFATGRMWSGLLLTEPGVGYRLREPAEPGDERES